MGKYKFKLSNMIPSAWFYKLKDMNTKNRSNNCNLNLSSTSISTSPPLFHNSSPRNPVFQNSPKTPLKSNTNSPNPARKSTKNNHRRKSTRSCRPSVHEDLEDPRLSTSWENHSTSTTKDIGIDDGDYYMINKSDIQHGFDQISNNLPRIITKNSKLREEPKNRAIREQRVLVKEKTMSPKLRLRINSPRLSSKKISGRRSNSLNSDSLAIVKSSLNPYKDFRDSMVEMILEKNLRESKDLEDLLACYLSLNSDEYHDIIIKVFKQIWLEFDFNSS